MTNFRALWWIALVFTLFMLWTEWTQFVNRKEMPAAAEVHSAQTAAATAGDVPAGAPAQMTRPVDAPVMPGMASAGRVTVKTDVLDVEIDTRGADLRMARLPAYAVSREDETPFTLMADKAPYHLVAQSGFTTQGSPAPTHHDVFQSASNQYVLADGASELRVPLSWEKDGVQVIKTYVFTRGSYAVQVETQVRNQGSAAWQASPYHQLVRNDYDPSSSFWLPTYAGGVLYDDVNKYDKIDFSDMAKQAVARDAAGGWLAMIQHYFLAAIVPPAQETAHYYSKALEGGKYALGLVAPAQSVAAGAEASSSVTLYVGPKLQNDLEKLAPGLDLTVDYGVLAFMAKPMFWLLEMFNELVEPVSGLWSWGWAIILLTLLIKAAFYKLSEAGYKSMANLRKLAPRLQHLKDNYGHDKLAFQQKMMEMYKTEKINPLGGCLPILIQIPVFLALYWVLLEAVELRLTPFLWLDDLSHYDPFFILPILMGVTMVVQQKLNPPPTDPMQEKVMKFLPYIFTVFFLFIPSGLVLYWVVNNALSILQQWHITRKIEAQDKPPAHHQG